MTEPIPVLGFAGFSGSGKTTLIEKIVHNLASRGVRTAVIKHDTHGIEIDHKGKDSERFSRAGADISIVCGPNQSAFIYQTELSLERAIFRITDVDIILVEGWKSSSIPQIGISREANGKGFTSSLDRYVAIVTDCNLEDCKIPSFSFEDIKEITDFIMQNLTDFTHFNSQGRAKMVDVGEKSLTKRTATAASRVLVSKETFRLIQSGGLKKGDVLTVAQIAGVMGAKRTPDLIPMCHPIQIHGIDLTLSLDESKCSVEIYATVSCDGKTGVEMEALTAATIAALTVYDMCKAVQKDIEITDIRLVKKTGGIHGDFQREEET